MKSNIIKWYPRFCCWVISFKEIFWAPITSWCTIQHRPTDLITPFLRIPEVLATTQPPALRKSWRRHSFASLFRDCESSHRGVSGKFALSRSCAAAGTALAMSQQKQMRWKTMAGKVFDTAKGIWNGIHLPWNSTNPWLFSLLIRSSCCSK